ncbi:MAG: hypothetical protein WD317_05220 [Balneolaceae bacterium]
MFSRLLYLNWKFFIARLSKFQTLVIAGYIIFLLIMLFNLMGTALVVIFLEDASLHDIDLPWLTDEVHQLIVLAFANVLWIMHFAFTSTRLLNIDENRKLLAYGYPSGRLAWHLNLMSLYHPVNVIYNLTWIVFLSVQLNGAWNVPVLIMTVLLNYCLIYSVKHRFLHLMERQFKIVSFSILFIILGTFQALAAVSRTTQAWLGELSFQMTDITQILYYLPGGLLYWSATYSHEPFLTGTLLLFCLLLVYLIFKDHYNKTLEGLLNPVATSIEQRAGRTWTILKTWLGPNAGKYYYYMILHPYNRLQLVAIILIPLVYIPLLLYLEQTTLSAILIPTMLAAIPVALLAIGMANMFGYENREFLLHMQFPFSFEKQLKERFLGIITVPLFIFYGITIFEITRLPQVGFVADIYIANTFFFLCFMMMFLWSSFYQFQEASYSSFRFKHPVIPQKVTFTISVAIFTLGYAVFAPIGEYHIYRLWVMTFLIFALGAYLWKNFEVLVKLYHRKILGQLWNRL